MKALVDAALVGTGHQPDRARAALAGEEPVDAIVGQLDESIGVERRVLLAAALHDTYARAGRVARSDVEAVYSADAETRAPCAPPVTALLGELFERRPRVLLVEALERLDGAHMIVPPALLPALLDLRDPLLAAIVPHVMGARGCWLVGLTGGGEWLVDDTPAAAEARRVWEEGPFHRRLAVLRARLHDSPAEGRAWLAGGWAAESAEHRAQLLAVLGETLDANDATFLEQMLADPSAHVRGAAARLLARLPHSDAARRFVERADALLAYEPPSGQGLRARFQRAVGLTQAGTLIVHPPEKWEPAWERDGISAKPANGLGERAHWLTEQLALVAPDHWTQRFDTDPHTLVRAALKTDWAVAVLYGWSLAAVAVRDRAWAAALWDAWLDDVKADDAATRPELAARGTLMIALHRAMSADDAETRALALMRRPPNELPFGLAVIVDVVPAPWTADYSRRFIAELAPLLSAAGASAQWTPATWFESLEPVALRLAPASFHDALALEQRISAVDTLPPAFRRKIEEFRDVVRLRQRIHEEIPGEPTRP